MSHNDGGFFAFNSEDGLGVNDKNLLPAAPEATADQLAADRAAKLADDVATLTWARGRISEMPVSEISAIEAEAKKSLAEEDKMLASGFGKAPTYNDEDRLVVMMALVFNTWGQEED